MNISKNKNVFTNLIPGKSLCPKCNKKTFGVEEKVSDIDVDFQPETEHEKSLVGVDTSLTELDTVCKSLHLSLASKLIKVSKPKCQSALKTKEKNKLSYQKEI